ncbi:hypothetical protein BDFB_008829 [Asbolus verrucosus]|uniref:Uncharacterized protein n=1 Tax=Asbolus verrucosus TaxID=1661398 RepID=A0A482W245_ASBVE|nr:hypothetical protein BDFB_008829 [Asbolus verrucosus]
MLVGRLHMEIRQI